VIGGENPAAPACGGVVMIVAVVCVIASLPVVVENCAHFEFLNTMGR